MQWFTILVIGAAYLQLSAERSQSVAKRSTNNYRSDGNLLEDDIWNYVEERRKLPTGCVLNNGKYLNFGETYKSTHYVFRCEKVNSTHFTLRPVKCVVAGHELDRGESIRTASFVLTCRQQGNRILGLQVSACVGDFGYAVAFGKTFKKDGFLFRCVKKGKKALHIAIGCVIHGTAVSLSETITVGDFWYKCARYGSSGVQSKVMGCVDNYDERFYPGEKYRKDRFVYLCKETSVGISIALIGCIGKEFDTEKEYAFGQSWYTKPVGPSSFRMICLGNETSATVAIAQCIVDLELGRKVANVGQCVKYDDKRVLTCIEDANGSVTARLATVDQRSLDENYPVTVEGVECPRIDD
ncbi:hypothetical protein D918_02768 [Trichuris suis]|nr:hypothetical protein D918_02768 [Trichuris suis]